MSIRNDDIRTLLYKSLRSRPRRRAPTGTCHNILTRTCCQNPAYTSYPLPGLIDTPILENSPNHSDEVPTDVAVIKRNAPKGARFA